MKKLNRFLNAWVNAGLISAEQMKNIITYEEKKGSEGRSKWIMYGFVSLGICVISIGVISLIAANWEYIPGMVKLIFDFIILLAVAYVIFRFRNTEKDYVWDSLLTFFAFLCLASIALISQVYHTGGELWQALAFWLIITIPAVHMTRKKLLPHIWILAFLFTLISWLLSDNSPWQLLTASVSDENEFMIFLTLPFLCLVLDIVFERFRSTGRYGEIFRIWSVLGGIFIAGAVDIYYSVLGDELVRNSLIPLYALAAVCIVLLFTISKYSYKQKIIITIMTVLTAAVFIPYNYLNAESYHLAADFIGAGFSMIIFLLFAMLFILNDRRKLFNLATLLIGLRFLIIYFQVFGGLAATGFGLIFSGLIIIGIAFLWFKKREKFENWLGGKIK